MCKGPHLLPHSTPLSSLSQPGPICSVMSHSAHVYSSTQPRISVPITPLNTPVCSTAQPQSSYQPSQVTNQTPNIPSILAKEPSPITCSEQPLAPESAAVQVNSKMPAHNKKSNTEQNYSFGSVGDVMDLLFMSSSQLDAHLSAHKIVAECEPTKTTLSELVPMQTLPVSQTPPSDLSKCENDDLVSKQKGNGVSLATLDPKDDLNSDHATANGKDVQVNSEEQANTATRSNLKAKAFHYPTKQKSSLKRKKSNIRTREYSVAQKSPERTDVTKPEVEEPLAKRPRIRSDSNHDSGCSTIGDQTCETTDDVTKVEESMIVVDHFSKNKSPPCGTEMDIDTTEKKVSFGEHLEEKASHSSCSTTIPSEQSRGQSEDMQMTAVIEKGNTVPMSSENTAMACMSIRAPGLRRTNIKSKVPVANYPPPKELNCETKVHDATESVAKPMQCPSAVEPPELQQLAVTCTSTIKNSVSKDSPFLGFQTAAGSTITVSEQAMKVACQLIGAECEVGEGHPNKSPETPKLISHTLSTTTTVISASSGTPSVMQEANLNATTFTSTSSTSPCLPESVGNSRSSAATFPRRPSRHPAKPFKAPRRANDVSTVEEQASVARILRSFRASGAATEPSVHKSTRSRVCRQPIETGFQTAGGLRVTVSSEAMVRAQKLVAEDKENGISTDTGSPLLISNRNQHLVTGFKTASGSKLMVSGAAMEKAENLVAKDTEIASTDADSPLLISNGRKEQLVTRFKTASGMRLMVSNEAMEKAQKFVDESKVNEISADVTCNSPLLRKNQVATGFKTASGKKLSASASAITQAAVKFKEDASTPNHNSTTTVGFQMASGKNHSVSALSMQKAESLLSSELGLDTESTVNIDSRDFVPTGFKTAGGSGISVLSKSLKRAEKLVEEEDDNLRQFDDIKTSLFQSPHREEMRENAGDLMGFSTAGGTSISVSRTSLQECEKLIETGASVNFDCFTTVESGGSPCSLTAEDIESFGAFTQMKFERQSPKSLDKSDLLPHSPTDIVHSPSVSATHNEEHKECDVDEDAKASGNENDDHDCFFSTQVVKQLTDFSSEEEMSCDEENKTAAAPQCTDELASCNTNTISDNNSREGCGDDQLVEAQEESGEDVHVQSQTQHNENHDDFLSGEENDSVVGHSVDAEAVDLLSESLLLREYHEAESRDHPGVDESTMEVNLSGVLSESMIENMDVSINISTVQPNSQEQATATELCVVNATSGSHQTNQAASEKPQMETPLQHLASFPGPSQPSVSDPLQSSSTDPQPCLFHPSLGHSQVSLPCPSQPSPPGPQPSLPGHSEPSLPVPSQSSLPDPSKLLPPESSLVGPSQPSSVTLPQFPGLQTASGKKVHIPESALNMARQVLGSSSSDPMLPTVHDDKPRSLLQTASGKPVHVSEASLRAVRGILTDGGETRSTANGPSSPERGFEHIGLQTASGKKVRVSESALLAVKEMLGSSSDDILPSNSAASCEPPPPHPIGLTTAGGRKVQISEEALAAVRSSSGAASMNTGLQTASGNKVEISEESMRATKLLLNSDPSTSNSACSSSTGSGFPGLSTASGTKVAISQKALEAARATLDDTAPPCTPNQNRPFSGLMTASGSKVTVSEESLQAARAVLGGISIVSSHCNDIPPVSITSAPRKDDFTRMSSKSQPLAPPVTTLPCSLPGAPTRKYKPIFRSGGTRNERGHTSFSSRMTDAITTPLTSAGTREQQQLPTQSRAGVISTPEGKLSG